MPRATRTTVDLSGYPDLVVVYLGMKALSLRGVFTLLGFGPKISASVAAKPNGLLRHENFLMSLWPLHGGMRQYWRDFDALEKWTRSLPHKAWWVDFLKDPKGVMFWHETYFMRGGVEAIFDNMNADHINQAPGLAHFAPNREAHGPMYSARRRLGIGGEETAPNPVPEQK
ncbi:MAG: DUF4188 domain-containing protein [Bryobacteraceae bacterium]|jgi:hypothetical protein